MTPLFDRKTEVLFTILIYCGEGQENKCLLALNSELNMGGPCQSPCSDFLLLTLLCFQDMRDMLPYPESEVLYNSGPQHSQHQGQV